MRRETIVALVQIEVIQNHSQGYIAGRILPLGLTGYGEDPEAAMRCVKRMFNAFVHAHREKGTLEDRMNRSGLEWYWLDQYPSDKPEYEDTNDVRDDIPNKPVSCALPMAA